MTRIAKVAHVSGRTFEIVADGDWGGGDPESAVAEVIETLGKMTEKQREYLHAQLVAEAEADLHAMHREADEIVTLGTLAHFANPPDVDMSPSASLHVYAVAEQE